MSTALYRKWRSQSFTEVIGQDHVIQTLRNALREGRVAHAYLFAGPRGTGKTSVARIMAKALNCSAAEAQRPCGQCPTCIAISEGRMLDLIEIDAASNNSVDDIRELRDKVGFRPSEGRYKVYIIDEVHMLSLSAFNALLKTLEEPPPHTRFILATTEAHKIPATILSRCQRFDFRRIPVPEIAGHLRTIVQAEGFAAEDEALTAIARAAQGCMRDAVSLLDQMLSYGAEHVTFAQVQQVLGAVNMQLVLEFVDALAARQVSAGLTLIQQLMTQGASLAEFCQQVVEHLRGVMVIQMTGDAALLRDLPAESVRHMQRQAQQLSPAVTLFAIKRFGEAVAELKGGFQPQLPLEMALIEAARGEVARAPAAAPPLVAATGATPVAAPPAQPAATPAMPAIASSDPQSLRKEEPPPLDAAAVKQLRERWKEFSNLVRGECGFRVESALKAVRNVAISDKAVAFAFGDNTFSHGMVAQPEVSAQVAGILSRILGRPLTLECQMGSEARLANVIRVEADNRASGPDPLLEYAVSNLGAEIVEKE